MEKANLKALAQKFHAAANDHEAVKKLARETRQACPGDADVADLCMRMEAAGDPDAVRGIADEVTDSPSGGNSDGEARPAP